MPDINKTDLAAELREWPGDGHDLRHRAADAIEALSEALGPFDRLGQIILAEAPPEAQTIVLFTSVSGEKFAVKLDQFRRARTALEANHG